MDWIAPATGIIFALGLLALAAVYFLRLYDYLRWYVPQLWNYLFGTVITVRFPAAEDLPPDPEPLYLGATTVEELAVTGKTVRLDQLPSVFDRIYLFEDENGERHHFELRPGHFGFFGASGSGKTNAVKLLLLEALRLGPERVQVVVLDYKRAVDYSAFSKFPQVRLYRKNTTEGYKEVVEELERRLDLFYEVEAENLDDYNEITSQAQLPYVLVLCDEVADLTLPENKVAAPRLREIFAKGRAAGIIGVAITQSPTADLLPSSSQANILHRFVFKLASSKYTSVALGLGPGEEAPPIDPATFDTPGQAVYKREGGAFSVVSAPHLTVKLRREAVAELKRAQGVL